VAVVSDMQDAGRALRMAIKISEKFGVYLEVKATLKGKFDLEFVYVGTSNLCVLAHLISTCWRIQFYRRLHVFESRKISV
jgi:hypothetical protein